MDRLERELERQQDQIFKLAEIVDRVIENASSNQESTKQIMDYIQALSKAVAILIAKDDERNGTKH